MKTIVVKEGHLIRGNYDYVLDLEVTPPRRCTGCWSCWTRTPGQCAQKDLDEYFRQYVSADKVIILSKVVQGFVSGKMKTVLDRSISLFLPYITYKTGESMHIPRYEKMPEVEVYYQGNFLSEEEERVYTEYWKRTMYQFYTKCDVIKPITEFREGAVAQ